LVQAVAPRRAAQRGIVRVTVIASTVLFFVAALTLLLVREVLMPRLPEYRPQIVAALEQVIGLPVSIEGLSADWQGLRPRLHLAGLTVLDRAGESALRLERVDATLSWSSLLRAQAHFHRLVFLAPELVVRREADGQVFIAGVRVDPDAPDSGFTEWLLEQREVVIRGASFTWTDHLRAAPPLHLEALDFRLWHAGQRYRFGLRAEPPTALATRLDVRGDLNSAQPGDVSTWAGELYLALDGANLGAWQQWVDAPLPLTGLGGVRAWAKINNGSIGALSGNLALDGVKAQLGEDLPELVLTRLRGWLEARRSGDGYDFSARALELVSGADVRVLPADIDVSVRRDKQGRTQSAKVVVSHLDVAALAHLAVHLPFEASVRARLAGLVPHGSVDDLRFDWQGGDSKAPEWRVKARFSGMGSRPHDKVPGFSGISGEIDGNQSRGRYRFNGRDAVIELPEVFPEPSLKLSTVEGDGGWLRRENRLEIALDNLRFENPDAAGSASGVYRPIEGGSGEIDLSARLTEADALAVWRYMPRVVNEPTRAWLRDSLTGGSAPESRLRLKGDLDRFPFIDGSPGQFLVTVQVAGARLDYAKGWPAIHDINGELRFEGAGMYISAESGRILGAKLHKVTAEVPDLDAEGGQIMTLRGKASGATAEFLRFVSASPVRQRIDGFTDDMRAQGNGALDLDIVLPLHHVEQAKIKGEFRFSGNTLTVLEGLPPLAQAKGRVRFTERDLTITDARAVALGEPVRVSARTPAGGGVKFMVAGGASMRGANQLLGWPVLAHLSGSAAWNADIDVRTTGSSVLVRSDLGGISSSLPAPMNKRAADIWPLLIKHEFDKASGRARVSLSLDRRAEFELVRRRKAGEWVVEKAGLGLFAPLSLAENGLLVSADLKELDIDAWRKALHAPPPLPGDTTGVDMGLPVRGVDLRVGKVHALGQVLSDFELDALADEGGWKGRVSSSHMDGVFDWRAAEQGALRARLKRLSIEKDAPPSGADAVEPVEEESPRHLPELDIVADQFSLRGMNLGRLALQAQNTQGLWALKSLTMDGPEGRFAGSGQWKPGRMPLTELVFSIQADDLGGFLDRLGYPGVVEGGNADMQGRVQWRGAPTRIDHATLAGELELDARRGQFRQLKPGVGRLLGVLSLQSLPRRLTLDFRDVFSEGFVFDGISGSIDIASGVMHTDNLKIAGPSARIWITGSANIEQETQDLRVMVQPTLSESVALGAAAGLINPVAGVVTYLAQKVLSDPIEKMFAFRYAINGSWTDPVVSKIDGSGAAPDAAAAGGK
jgi:uncharacterized protein (TIGR02099 family)